MTDADRASPLEREGDTPASAPRKQLLLRLTPAVHAAIAKWAADDMRSVNAQIEVLLRRSLAQAGRDPKAPPPRRPGRPSRSDEPDSQSS